jgi:hypothetical protein
MKFASGKVEMEAEKLKKMQSRRPHFPTKIFHQNFMFLKAYFMHMVILHDARCAADSIEL